MRVAVFGGYKNWDIGFSCKEIGDVSIFRETQQQQRVVTCFSSFPARLSLLLSLPIKICISSYPLSSSFPPSLIQRFDLSSFGLANASRSRVRQPWSESESRFGVSCMRGSAVPVKAVSLAFSPPRSQLLSLFLSLSLPLSLSPSLSKAGENHDWTETWGVAEATLGSTFWSDHPSHVPQHPPPSPVHHPPLPSFALLPSHLLLLLLLLYHHHYL